MSGLRKSQPRRVYLASPYRALGRQEAKRVAIGECMRIVEAGLEPVSPVLAFCDIYSEEEQRDVVIQECYKLLSSCDYIAIASHSESSRSEGIAQEMQWAKELGITQIEI